MSYIETGGSFMLPMLLLGLAGLGVLGYAIHASTKEARESMEKAAKAARLVKHIAIFLAVAGILSQAIGLYQALSVIESIGGDVSPALLAGGLKVSFIAPVFGLIEFLVLLTGYAFVRSRV